MCPHLFVCLFRCCLFVIVVVFICLFGVGARSRVLVVFVVFVVVVVVEEKKKKKNICFPAACVRLCRFADDVRR